MRAAVALAALFVGLMVFARAPNLTADASEMRFSPRTPQMGAVVRVEYQSSSLLAGKERLALRARYRWGSGDSVRTVKVTELKRASQGHFRGTFQLPDSVVYAVFAVEDVAGEIVDSNSRRGWEVLVHDSNGRPLYSSLEQRSEDLSRRNWELAFETVRTMASLYPERVGSWRKLRFYEQALLGETNADTLLEAHRARFAQFHRVLAARPRVSADDAGHMSAYAWSAGDTLARNYWWDRLAKEHPRQRAGVEARLIRIMANSYSDPTRLLGGLDQLWTEAGPVHKQVGLQGLLAARRLGDPQAILKWADRYLIMDGGDRSIPAMMTSYPGLREEGMQRLRSRIRHLQIVRDDQRPLLTSLHEQRAHDRRQMHADFAALGRALVAAGRMGPGLDTLKLAVKEGWDARLFRDAADTRLLSGDTAGALELWAKVAVDPSTRPAFVDSVRARATHLFDEPRWRSLTAKAEETMRQRVLADATTRSIRGRVRLLDQNGNTYALNELAAGKTTFVAFWSRFCAPSLEQLAALERLSDELQGQEVRVVAITNERLSPALNRFLKAKGYSFPVFQDANRDAARAFEQFGTPDYYVLDETGRIRFDHSSLDEIPRQVAALRNTTAHESEGGPRP